MRKSRYQRLYIKAFNSKGKNRLQYAHLFNDLLQSSADDEIHQVYFYGHTIFTCIKHAELDRDTLVRLRTIAIEFNDYYRQLHPSPDAWSEEEIIKHYEHALATC
ncbi:MAG: hypothetical protein KTR20_07795 [Cellvibrionaceae bacterium]|nr:hypothetical protein [Cellvibrionaceae bacterium]